MEEAAPPPPPPPPAPPAPAFSPTADAGLLARIDALFRAVDIDRSGEIDLSELRNYFGDVCEPLHGRCEEDRERDDAARVERCDE